MKKEINVNLKEKLDPSEIARFVQIANQYASALYIELDDNRRVSAKSIMGMMNFLADDRQQVVISAQGEDEEEALEAIIACLTGKE